MKSLQLILLSFALLASLSAQDLPPFMKVGTLMRCKIEGLRVTSHTTFKVLEINGKWMRLEQNTMGFFDDPVDKQVWDNADPVLKVGQVSDVGWFSVDKMSNIIEVK